MPNRALLRLTAILLAAFAAHAQSTITSPEAFFGFRMGADRKMARWDKMIEYYKLLEKQAAGRIKVIDMGPTTMGHPFLLVIVSSPANLTKLERLRQVNAAISDPRGVAEAEIRKLTAEGRAIIVQSMSMHATEIGGSQMAPELIYDLIARNDDESRRILDNVLSLIVPSFNPDGQIMVTDWYNKTLGTPYEGTNLPWLYHKYVGHDNNRDAFQTNMAESQYMARILFRDWIPQGYVDHHHMGSYNARIYVPPYAEPVRPGADPLVWRELSWFGSHIAYKEEEANLSGVINSAIYSGWGHFGFHWITPFHNIAGMLTESASARLASPLFIHPDQLRGGPRGLPTYQEQTTFPNPWPGGWWRLRDIVERQKVSAWAVLDLAARNRETVLWNAYLKAKRQTERGAAGKPAAFVIPAAQHDPLTATKLVNKLLIQGIEVHRAPKGIASPDGLAYPAGSFVVSMAQPKTGVVRYLLGRTFYPDNEWTRARDGSPIRPYDMSTDTMAEFMGVRVDPLSEAPTGDLQKVVSAIEPAGRVAAGASAWSFDSRLNDSFKAVNLLFDKGVSVRRADKSGAGVRPGDFLAGGASEAVIATVAKDTGVDFRSANGPVSGRELKRRRIGMYQRYGGGNMDEGWTRWILEQWRFPYTSLMDAEIKKGSLNDRYDVIILPDDSTAAITGERPAPPGGGRGAATAAEGGRGGGGGRGEQNIHPDYRTGIGAEGVAALRAFVEKGGTLITLGGASNFAVDRFGLGLRNVIAGVNSKEFWCPGSTLKLRFETNHPLAYGMPAEGLAVYLTGNPVWEVVSTTNDQQLEIIARYADRELLQSGWLIGEEIIARRAAVVSARLGSGRIVLSGIRPQHRAQTHGTFKLLFNAMVE